MTRTTRVAVLTDFYDCNPAYSLNIIAEGQLSMLLNAGYEPVGVVQKDFKPQRVWKDVELRHIPQMPHHNEIRFVDGWEERVDDLVSALDKALTGVNVVITHDMIYQPAELILNFAARRWARENRGVTWLNWVHSASPSAVWANADPRLQEVQVHMPNSFTVYPNHWFVERVARSFNCEVSQVAVVPHPTDPFRYLGFQEITERFVRDKHLLDYEFILVYPVRLDRGKQVEHVINAVKGFYDIGRSAVAVVVDFHSTGGDKVVYRGELKEHAEELGVGSHVHFTSEYDESLFNEAPREMVRDLMFLCNVLVMPSRSETYSLIVQEAALCGAFLVLNWDFQPFLSIYGEKAAYFKFSSNVNYMDRHLPPPPPGEVHTTDVTYGDTQAYFRMVAMRCAYEMDNNAVMNQMTRIRRQRNPDYVFRRYVEPLFFAGEGRTR